MGILTGAATRVVGVICAVNFIVALVMVDAVPGPRAAFPSAMLILTGLLLTVHGAGFFSLDRLVLSVRRRRPV